MAENLRYFEYGKVFTTTGAMDYSLLNHSHEYGSYECPQILRELHIPSATLESAQKRNKFIALLPYGKEYALVQSQARREGDYARKLGLQPTADRPFNQTVCIFLRPSEIETYFAKGIPLYSLLLNMTGNSSRLSDYEGLLQDYINPGKVINLKFPELFQSTLIKSISPEAKKVVGAMMLGASGATETLDVFRSASVFGWKSMLEIAEQLQTVLYQDAYSLGISSNYANDVLTFASNLVVGKTVNVVFFDSPRPPDIKAVPPEIVRAVDLDSPDLPELRNFEQIKNIWTAYNNQDKSRLIELLFLLGQTDAAEIKLLQFQSLDLSGMNLADLFRGISKLPNLNTLDLSKNQFKSIPLEIGGLSGLRSLNFANNQITSLPTEICHLDNLRSLDLSNNHLTFLPSEVSKLSKLTSLNLSNNELSVLPDGLKNIQNLQFLDLRGNPLPIPPEILEKTSEPQIIFNYYDWILEGKRQPLSETKMLVVGQGSVGKTSLIKRLTGGKFRSRETKTDGIAINSWQVKNAVTGEHQPDTLQVNIWDFGGQEIMHATHQFFLTRRSLYMLVLDARLTQEENRVEYWLKIIQSFGGDSPVLLVGNKIDQHPLDIDRTGLQRKYPNVVGILETSASTGTGLEELQAAIAEQVNNLPHIRDVMPEAWFKVKNQITKLGQEQNFITHDDYINIWCTENRVCDPISQRTLISFLHDLGIVLYFQDEPRLEALGILNPQWVTNGVYKILNAHTLFQNKGMLERAMLSDILPEDDYPANKRLFIIDMMRKFELCYDLEPDKTFLVPDLLPKDEPFTGEWEGALAFQYHYSVLPSSVISRFIVRMNTYIHKTVWRAGAVLKKGDNTALVKADVEDRKIYIWVNGAENTRRDFLSAIRAELDAIHKTIIKIEAREKVPVPGRPDVVIDFEHLLKLERMGEASFIPEGLDQRVNVRELLSGVRIEQEASLPTGAQPLPAELPEPESQAHQPGAVKSVEYSAKKLRSMPWQIAYFVFVSVPRAIGILPLDLFGKGKDAAPSTPVLLGYVIIGLAILILLGVLSLDAARDWFAGLWRFFNPVK